MIRAMHLRAMRLTVKAFRGWLGAVEVELDRPITAVVGLNRRGKSSLLNAVEWCLFGSEVAKKSPGLEERAGWEVGARGAGDRPTVVSLRLADEDGEMRLTRTRKARAKTRDADDVVLELPDGSRHTGDDAIGELRAAGLPDWETWRRAHGFHQEAARTRVTDVKDRSAVLATLLGLEEDVQVRAAIEAANPARLVKDLDLLRERTEDQVQERLANPQRDLAEVEERLVARGLDRSALGPGLLAEMRGRLVSEAQVLAAQLQLEVELPAADDAQAVRDWASAWLHTARGQSPALAKKEALRKSYATLRDALRDASTARKTLQEVEARHRDSVAEGGDLEARAKAHAAATTAREDAEGALKRTNQAAALLAGARELVPDTDAETACPVCTTPVPALGAQIDAALATLGSEAVAGATRTLGEARAREEAARKALRAAESTARDLADAGRIHAEARAALAARLGVDPDEDGRDLVAAGNARLETLTTEGLALGDLAARRDESLNEHGRTLDLIGLLESWERMSARAERIVELDALPSWQALEAAVDEAAALASDLEVLATMAREVQEVRSADRTEVVNTALGRYYALITGRSESDGIRVEVKRTAKRISYELNDSSGQGAVPVLNQAALNALSLAMLFAQAEERARHEGLTWVVLDDPIQSLDDAHQAGLATALEVLAETCQVLVASVPSAFVTRLEDFVATPRRFVTLGTWSAEQGGTVEEVRTL